jgi:adenylate cyclase
MTPAHLKAFRKELVDPTIAAQEGLSWATNSMRQRPNVPAVHATVIACQAMPGRVREAQQACALALQLDPTQRISDTKDRMPFRRTEDIEKFAEALRIAGMPE